MFDLFAFSPQVLLQWRHAALLQARYQQQKVTAVLEARKRLDIGELVQILRSQKTANCTVLSCGLAGQSCASSTEGMAGWSIKPYRMGHDMGPQWSAEGCLCDFCFSVGSLSTEGMVTLPPRHFPLLIWRS